MNKKYSAVQTAKANTLKKLLSAVLALAILACLMAGCNKNPSGTDASTTEPVQEHPADNTTVQAKAVYSEDGITIEDPRMADVIATCGDFSLTNGVFQLYYRMQYLGFMNSYGSIASSLQLDSTKPLAEQQSLDQDMTWEQYFVSAGMQQYMEYAACEAKAKAVGFQLDSEIEDFLATAADTLNDDAIELGYDSALAYIQEVFGPGVSLEDYCSYLRTYYTAMYYQDSLFLETYDQTDKVTAYFEENKETFEERGLTMTDLFDVNVRHILIAPEDGDGDQVSTEEEWAAAEERVREVYEEYLTDPTEEHFASIATRENATSDPNSAESGGLYENVYPGSMVAEFSDWCFDSSRAPGDAEIVKTKFGYHIIYFVSTCDTQSWRTAAASELTLDVIDNIIQEYPAAIDYSAIVLAALPLEVTE